MPTNRQLPSTSSDVFVVGIVKGREKYVVTYTAAGRRDRAEALARWARNPGLAFTWEDAEKMADAMRDVEEAKPCPPI